MDYPLAISPDLQIDAEEFASAWNQNPESSNIAQAHVSAASKESYPFIPLSSAKKRYALMTPEMIHQGLVLLAGVAGTVALDVVKDAVKDRITKFLAARFGSNAAPPFEVIVIQPGDKTMIIVKAKA
jgi:hypothetical protein